MKKYKSLHFLRNGNLKLLTASKNTIVFSIALFAILVIVPNVLAATYYVDNAANGSNNGTSWANAWQSFSAITWGGAGIVAGDTIYISGGSTTKTYTNTLAIGASGSSNSNRIWIRPGSRAASPSGHDGTVILRPTTGVAVQFGGYDYVTLDGNDGAGNRDFQVNATGGFGGRAGAINSNSGSHGNQVLYVFVDESGSANNEHGVVLDSDGTYPHELAYSIVEDVWQDAVQSIGCSSPTGYGSCVSIHHNILRRAADDIIQGDGGWDVFNNTIGPHAAIGGGGHPDGIQAMAGYLRFYNNIFIEDFEVGGGNCMLFVDFYFADRDNDNVRIYNNLFIATRSAVINHAICLWGQSMDDAVVANNTIVDIPRNAVSISSGNRDAIYSDIVVENNIFYNTGYSPTNGEVVQLGPYAKSSTVTVDNNLLYGGNSGNTNFGVRYYNAPTTTVRRTLVEFNSEFSVTNITGSPSFVNYAENNNVNNNYHLAVGDTAATNVGVDLSSLTGMDTSWPDDFDSISRPRGSAWDIGAYEYTSGDNISPAPPFLNPPE